MGRRGDAEMNGSGEREIGRSLQCSLSIQRGRWSAASGRFRVQDPGHVQRSREQRLGFTTGIPGGLRVDPDVPQGIGGQDRN